MAGTFMTLSLLCAGCSFQGLTGTEKDIVMREIYLRRREHETDKNNAPAGTGGEAGNGCEMPTGSNGPNDGAGDRETQYPLDQPPDRQRGRRLLIR